MLGGIDSFFLEKMRNAWGYRQFFFRENEKCLGVSTLCSGRGIKETIAFV
jgi:hypothetical protein